MHAFFIIEAYQKTGTSTITTIISLHCIMIIYVHIKYPSYNYVQWGDS